MSEPVEWVIRPKKMPKPGQPCDHPGCLHHITHPCDGCGRIGGVPRGEE